MSKWTYDSTHHMMTNLDAIIALALMKSVLSSDYYELHHVDDIIFDNLLIGKIKVDCILCMEEGLFISCIMFCACLFDPLTMNSKLSWFKNISQSQLVGHLSRSSPLNLKVFHSSPNVGFSNKMKPHDKERDPCIIHANNAHLKVGLGAEGLYGAINLWEDLCRSQSLPP